MPSKVSTVVKLNRAALTEIREREVRAMEALGQQVLSVTNPPDATPFGEGLVTTGNYGVWSDGKKVGGDIRKPKRLDIKRGVTLVVGWGFPGRFQVLGTIHQPPRPGWFVDPMNETVPQAPSFLQRVFRGLR